MTMEVAPSWGSSSSSSSFLSSSPAAGYSCGYGPQRILAVAPVEAVLEAEVLQAVQAALEASVVLEVSVDLEAGVQVEAEQEEVFK